MKATVKHIVKKVTLESIYDVVDERTKEIKEDIKTLHKKMDEMRAEYTNGFKEMRTEFTNELKEMRTEFTNELKEMRAEYTNEFKQMRSEHMNEFNKMRAEYTNEFKEMRAEYKDDFKSINGRIDQIHTRLDQMMHMLSDLKSSLK